MSVVGFDIGNDGCFVAEIKRGGVDMVLNENSNRRTPHLVSIQEGKMRLTGEQAGSISKSNYKNTVASVKPYIGRTYKECEEELKTSPVKAVEMKDGSVGWEVIYDDEPTVFSCQQILSMMLKELCTTVEKSKADGKGVRDVMIAVPGYFVESQRLAILDACAIAGVPALGLINEMTAVALGYGIWKSARNLFHESEPQNVMFVDIGYRSTSVCIASFVQGKLSIKSCAYNAKQGSSSVDMTIVKSMAAQYLEKHPGEDPMANPKAVIKMKAAADKAKKTISPEGVNLASITIECLMGDSDLNYRLELDKYNEMVTDFLDQLEVPILKCLGDAGLKPSDVHSVEVVGGGSRIKGVKQRISKVMELKADGTNFGVSTTMNADEAVARGCALMCAMRSPRFSVKPFSVVDVAQFPIIVQHDAAALAVSTDAQKSAGVVETAVGAVGAAVGAVGSAVGAIGAAVGAKVIGTGEGENDEDDDAMEGVTIEGQTAVVVQGEVIPSPQTLTVETKNEQNEFELIAAIPIDGDSLKYSAFVGDSVDQSALELMRYAVTVNTDTKEPVKLDVKHDRSGILQIVPQDNQVSVTYRSVGKLTSEAIAELVTLEQNMAAKDKAIRMTGDKRNELESFLYAFRDELSGELSEFLLEAEKSASSAQVQSAEDWLYSDDGFDSTLEVYSQKLQELQMVRDRPVQRRFEDQQRPAAVDSLANALTKYAAMAENSEDRARILALHGQVDTWLQALKTQQEPLPKTADPVLTVAAVQAKAKLIERLQRQASSLKELRKTIAGSVVLAGTSDASNDVLRNLMDEDTTLLQAEAQKVTEWLKETVDTATEFALPEKEDERPSPSSTEVDQKNKSILSVEDKAKAMSKLRSKLIEIRALKSTSAAVDTAAGDPASACMYAGLIDHDWDIIESECDALVEWVSSKANVDNKLPSAVDIRKRTESLESEVEKAACVSTLRSSIDKYSSIVEKEKEAEKYNHVGPESWTSLQSAVDTARGYVRENLECDKEGRKKFPEFVGEIRSANDSLSWTADDILFPQKHDGIGIDNAEKTDDMDEDCSNTTNIKDMDLD